MPSRFLLRTASWDPRTTAASRLLTRSALARSMNAASWSANPASSDISSSDWAPRARVWNSATASTSSGGPIGTGIASDPSSPSSAASATGRRGSTPRPEAQVICPCSQASPGSPAPRGNEASRLTAQSGSAASSGALQPETKRSVGCPSLTSQRAPASQPSSVATIEMKSGAIPSSESSSISRAARAR